jgi:hypothetical protein
MGFECRRAEPIAFSTLAQASLAPALAPDTVFRLMFNPQDAPGVRQLSPTTVAAAGWVLPGAGYWLLGDHVRALVAGVTIILLFIGGLLIGGVRVLEVPGYGTHGQRINATLFRDPNNPGNIVERDSEEYTGESAVWVMRAHPLDEIRNKPWSIAQVMTGPLSIVSAYGSVVASERPEAGAPPVGAKSHARVNEIGVLYTAVAGMLNLLAMIDAAHRAAREPA